eukprot:15344569-Ditylum_brightwellii.AAC.2
MSLGGPFEKNKRNGRRIKATSYLCISHLEVLVKNMQAGHLGNSIFQDENVSIGFHSLGIFKAVP